MFKHESPTQLSDEGDQGTSTTMENASDMALAIIYFLQSLLCLFLLAQLKRSREQVRVRKYFFLFCFFGGILRCLWFAIPDSVFAQGYLPQNRHPTSFGDQGFILNIVQFLLYAIPNLIYFVMYTMLICTWSSMIHIMFSSLTSYQPSSSNTTTAPSSSLSSSAGGFLSIFSDSSKTVPVSGPSGGTPISTNASGHDRRLSLRQTRLMAWRPALRCFQITTAIVILTQALLIAGLFLFDFFYVLIANCIFVSLLALSSCIGYITYAIVTVSKLRPLYKNWYDRQKLEEHNSDQPQQHHHHQQCTLDESKQSHDQHSGDSSVASSIEPSGINVVTTRALSSTSRSRTVDSHDRYMDDDNYDHEYGSDYMVDRGVGRGYSFRRESPTPTRDLHTPTHMIASVRQSVGHTRQNSTAGVVANMTNAPNSSGIRAPHPSRPPILSNANGFIHTNRPSSATPTVATSNATHSTDELSYAPTYDDDDDESDLDDDCDADGTGSDVSHSSSEGEAPIPPPALEIARHNTSQQSTLTHQHSMASHRTSPAHSQSQSSQNSATMPHDDIHRPLSNRSPDLPNTTNTSSASTPTNMSMNSTLKGYPSPITNTHGNVKYPVHSLASNAGSGGDLNLTLSPVPHDHVIREEDFFQNSPSDSQIYVPPSSASLTKSSSRHSRAASPVVTTGSDGKYTRASLNLPSPVPIPPAAFSFRPSSFATPPPTTSTPPVADDPEKQLALFSWRQTRKIILLTFCVTFCSAARIASSLIELHYTWLEVEADQNGSTDGGSNFPALWWIYIDVYYLLFEVLSSTIAIFILTHASRPSVRSSATIPRSSIINRPSSPWNVHGGAGHSGGHDDLKHSTPTTPSSSSPAHLMLGTHSTVTAHAGLQTRLLISTSSTTPTSSRSLINHNYANSNSVRSSASTASSISASEAQLHRQQLRRIFVKP